MAIDSYSALKTAIGQWMFDQGAVLSANYDEFIANAESRFNYGSSGQMGTPPLRVRQMEASSDLTLSSAEASLPADYLEWRRVAALTSPRNPLAYVTPEWLDDNYPTRSATWPVYFTIEGSVIRVVPTSTADIEFKYYQKIPALSDSQTTNWLLTAMPNIYLYACCLEAALFAGDQERGLEMMALLSGAMNSLEAQDKRARWIGGRSRVRGPNP